MKISKRGGGEPSGDQELILMSIWNPTEIWRPSPESQVSCQNIF